MIRSCLSFIVIVGATTLILGAQYLALRSVHADAWISVINELYSFTASSSSQWIVVVYAGAYFLGFLVYQCFLRTEMCVKRGRALRNVFPMGIGSPRLCLLVFVGVATLSYVVQYPISANRPDFLVLLIGLTLGQGAGALERLRQRRGDTTTLRDTFVPPLIFVLSVAMLFHPEMQQTFQYRHRTRWTGLWGNPNSFGMLAGLGLTLAVGRMLNAISFEQPAGGTKQSRTGAEFNFRWTKLVAYIVAASSLGIGLINSYSRGAWIATGCGLAYLVYTWRRFLRAKTARATNSVRDEVRRPRWLPLPRPGLARSLGIICLSFAIIGFWSFRYAEERLIRRLYSVANMNDFSWRNRLSASIGALQMMSDAPWLGLGWHQPEEIYNAYYRRAKLVDGKAIVLNDYFMVGMTLGLPALGCFLLYLHLTFVFAHRACLDEQSRQLASHWGATVCRAGFLVMAIGFVPECGLFSLALGTPFWVLLELGTVGDPNGNISE